MSSFKDLKVWEKAINLTVEIYKITENFPKEEIYGLTSQMRRSSVSTPSNIAEGRNRGTKKDFCNFLRIALGSCAELSTQIEISKKLSKTKEFDYTKIEFILTEIMKMLYTMIRKLSISNS
jgi:four helix bundle protein